MIPLSVLIIAINGLMSIYHYTHTEKVCFLNENRIYIQYIIYSVLFLFNMCTFFLCPLIDLSLTVSNTCIEFNFKNIIIYLHPSAMDTVFQNNEKYCNKNSCIYIFTLGGSTFVVQIPRNKIFILNFSQGNLFAVLISQLISVSY